MLLEALVQQVFREQLEQAELRVQLVVMAPQDSLAALVQQDQPVILEQLGPLELQVELA